MPDDFDAKLRQFQLAVQAMPRYVREHTARLVRARVERRIDNQFINGRDPYGARWPQPKDGHRPAMIRSGALRSGYRIQVVESGSGLSLRVSNTQHYAMYLQRGTPRMTPRKQVPDGALPEPWRDDFHRAYEEGFGWWYARLAR